MSKRLSILICSLHSRQTLLNRLLAVLNKQVAAFPDQVSVLVNTDSGEKSIGQKRNELIASADGDYVCFIDDDDLVVDNYVQMILQATHNDPDCVGIEGIITFQGQNPRRFVHSIDYNVWFEHNEVYFRCPNHLNPVKRSIAQQVPFPESNFGEDKDYSIRLFPLLKTENFIGQTLYYYLYNKPLPSQQSAPRYRRRRRR